MSTTFSGDQNVTQSEPLICGFLSIQTLRVREAVKRKLEKMRRQNAEA